jgi:uncharacterized membrane-anchored protein
LRRIKFPKVSRNEDLSTLQSESKEKTKEYIKETFKKVVRPKEEKDDRVSQILEEFINKKLVR